jgi:hypothetical protein
MVRSSGPASIESLEMRQLLTMALPTTTAAGTTLSDVQLVDVNHDGHQDLVGLNSGSSQVSVSLGNGDGTFGAAINSAAGGTGAKMAVADFNHDGNLDLVTIEGYNVDVLRGNGDGSFQTPSPYYASAYPNDIDVGDVNNDGFDDIFTASFSYGGTTQLFINDGLGGFLPSHNLAIGPTGLQIEGADVNKDGNLDLIQSSGSGYIAVLVGHGDGTFISAAAQNIGMTSSDVQSGDFNGDGYLDLAVSNSSQISVFNGSGTTAFLPPTSYLISGSSRLQAGDVNGDGNLDIVGNNGIVLLSRGSGGFYAPTAYGTAVGNPIALGDVDGDGSLDAVSGSNLAGGGAIVTLNAHNDQQLLAGATQISVSTSGSAIAGTPFSVTVAALDASGNVVTGFQGTVGIQGAPGTKPVSYTFTAADAGVHTVAGAATLFAQGQGTYSVTSPFLPEASGTISVEAGAMAKLTLTSTETATVAGGIVAVTVSASDAYGNHASRYAGTIHFTSSDLQAGLPSDYTFTADDAGTHTFNVTLRTAGTQTIFVGDPLVQTSRGISNPITVTGAGAVSLSMVGGGGFVGSVNAVTITARDAYGNVASSYNGVIHLSASDAGSTTSADAALINGVGTFTVTPTTMGLQTLTARDVATGAIVGSETINVTPGWGARFAVVPLPSITAAGQTQTTRMTVYDAFGNVSTVYTGWVVITSTDTRATSYVYFTAADAGVKDIPVTLYTAGVQAVTISDLSNPNVTFTQIGITVTPGAVEALSVTPLQSAVAGTVQSITVSGRDVYGNVATDYRGTVTFVSSDTQAVLPATYTFTSGDAGSHTFAVSLRSSGGQDITIADSTTVVTPQYYVTGTMTYYQRDIFVSAAGFSSFSFKASSASNTSAGAALDLALSATDAYGNAVSDYTGTALISSTDSQAVLPTSYSFTFADQGTHHISVIFKTAGTQTINVVDSVNSTDVGSTSIAVRAAAANKLAVTTSSDAKAGTAQYVTVAVTDAFGNSITNYTGTVKFSSSDLQATLPANYTFSNKDNGTHTFSVTFRTAGVQSLSASDTVNSSITGVAAGITVTQPVAAVASFSVTGFPATTAGSAKTFVVTARDALGNVVTGYRGTVNFSSSDVKAGLPATYTFTSTDAGTHTFTATLKTAGTQSITVKDSATSTILGTQSGIVITAGNATRLVITAPASVTQGVGLKITLTTYDDYGNVATGYRGTVHFTSSDSKIKASDYTFTSKDIGAHVFSVTFGTLGLQSLSFVDSLNPLLTVKLTLNVLTK